MATGELQHETLGRVTVNIRHNSRHISARWKNGIVNINIPYGAKEIDLHRILDDLTPRLIASRPDISFYDGQKLSFPLVEFAIRQQSFAPSKILGTASIPVSSVEVGSDWDFENDQTTRAVSDMLCKIARKIAPQALLPRAREIAAEIGRHPTGWTISTGHRILGQCTERGIISLSYVLIFLPDDLRDYVICHELAHLSELNHSPQFHALLNSYLNGREAELANRLHSYRWPVFRK